VSASEKAGKAGIKYVEYLVGVWMPKSLWDSWSEEGRIGAAKILGVNVDSVLSTTNHLESFNGVLKRKHVAQLQRSGKRLRFDVLIFRLVLHVLPNIYAQFRLLQSFKTWKEDRFSGAAGKEGVSCQVRPKVVQTGPSHLTVAWYSPDPIRDGIHRTPSVMVSLGISSTCSRLCQFQVQGHLKFGRCVPQLAQTPAIPTIHVTG
jgi:hypothetical protein